MKNPILLTLYISTCLFLSTTPIYSQQPFYEPTAPHLMGVQLGNVSGLCLMSKESPSEIRQATIGISEDHFALQLQINNVFRMQDRPDMSWYYGFLGQIITKNSPEVAGGIPFGIIYEMSEGPHLIADLAPVISVGDGFKVSLQFETRLLIPF